jgi:protein O-mannosyl-transferase
MRQPASQAKAVAAPVRARSRFPAWLIAVMLALGTMALYWPAMRCDFVTFDDDIYVRQNPHVQGGLNWQSVQWAFSNLQAGFWHPLTWLSILADCQFYGLRAWGHHLTSVLLHAANTVLLFLALQRMTGATWRSAFVAGLFGWHPLHVESVAWVSERKDVLSTFFWMLTMLMYVGYVAEAGARDSELDDRAKGKRLGTGKNGAWRGNEPLLRARRQPSWYYTLALLCFVCGLMSKPMVVTLPLMLLLLDWWPLHRLQLNARGLKLKQMLPLIWEKAPFLAAALVVGVVTIYAERGVGALGATTTFPLSGRVHNAVLSYVIYLNQTLWPTDLAVFYPYPETFPGWRTAGAGLVGLLLSALLLWAPRQRPYLAAGWIWYVVTLLPVIGLIQVGEFSRADRFTYMPLIGVFLALSWGGYELTRRWRYRPVVLSVAGGASIVFCLGLTRQQIGYWQDGETLFRHALAVTKSNDLAHNNLGNALDRKGQTVEAIRQYQEALRLKPNQAEAHNNLGYALGLQGQTDEAIHQYQEALRLKPHDADVHNNLGAALGKKGQSDEAIRQYQEALRLKPDHAEAHNNLGLALGRKGQSDEAIHQYQEAIRLKPDYAEAHNSLGAALEDQGQSDEAIRHYQAALRPKPDYADAHYNLGNAFGRKGQTDEAIRQFQAALRLKPDHAEAHNNLGIAFYQQRRIDEAIGQFQEALRLNPDFAGARRNLDVVLAAKARSSRPPGGATTP